MEEQIKVTEMKIEEPSWNSTDYNTLTKLAMTLPDEIMKYEKYIMALNRKNDAIDKRKKEMETKVFIAVSEEKEKYTNQALRDAETAGRLKASTEFNLLNEETADVIFKLHEGKAELEQLRNQMRGLEVVVDVLKIKYRVGI